MPEMNHFVIVTGSKPCERLSSIQAFQKMVSGVCSQNQHAHYAERLPLAETLADQFIQHEKNGTTCRLCNSRDKNINNDPSGEDLLYME